MRAPQDILSAPMKKNRAWTKFGESNAPIISASKDELAVARFFLQVLSAQDQVPAHLVERTVPPIVSAADAFAEAGVCGLGGWWLPSRLPLHPENIRWFSVQVRAADLPAWFTEACHANLQKGIAALEALAQLCLLASQCKNEDLPATVGWVTLRQNCDNFGVVCANAKGWSLVQPLASVLQSTTLFALRARINLRLTHVAGARHDWADALSRGRSQQPEFWQQLRSENRIEVPWLELLQLCQQPDSAFAGAA